MLMESHLETEFQSYRQTFRIEPDSKEAEKIIKSIIKDEEVV